MHTKENWNNRRRGMGMDDSKKKEEQRFVLCNTWSYNRFPNCPSKSLITDWHSSSWQIVCKIQDLEIIQANTPYTS